MDRDHVLYISDRIMRGSLIVYLLVMTIPHTAALRSILMILSILGLILRGLVTRRFPIRTTPLDIPILIYTTIIVLRSVYSIDPLYSLTAVRKELLYQLLFFYLTVSAMDSPRYTRRVILILIVTVTLVAGVGLFGFLTGDLIKEGRATSFFNSFGLAAFFTSMIMPMALSRFLCTRGWFRSIALGVLILCLAFMLVTMSRGAWISSLMAVMVLAALKDRRMLVLLLIGVISAPWFLPPDIIERATTITRIFSLEENDSFGDRIWMWRSAIQMIRDRPWLGAGYGNRIFQQLYPDYIHSQSSGQIFENAHNLYLQIVVETGLIGLASFLSILAVVFYLICVQFRRKPLPMIESQLLGIAGSFAVFLTFSFSTFRFENEIGILFWILAGCIVSLHQTRFPLSSDDPAYASEFCS
ncbi:O-antigen ligase family protein [bacterium]|nr:O-antigen ligase family protein [candidate division CSSED10-310 bacterium]